MTTTRPDATPQTRCTQKTVLRNIEATTGVGKTGASVTKSQSYSQTVLICLAKSGAPRQGFVRRRLERRQPVGGSCAVAAVVARAVCPGRFELAAWRGPQGIDRAADGRADGALECRAARRLPLRARHRGVMRCDLDRQLGRS